jgi:hypothetical protein
MNFKEKKDAVLNIVLKLELNFTSEDKEKITKLIETYFRKRMNIINSDINNLCGGLLWTYARINFLFEKDKSWSQQSIAQLLNVKQKTISNITSKIMDSLKINFCDERFVRKEISDQNPLKQFVMTESGFIVHKSDLDGLYEEFVDEDKQNRRL